MAALTTDQFANFALSTLAGGGSGAGGSLTATDTTLIVKATDGAKYSASGPYMVMLGSALGAHELVKVTARTSDTLTIVRAQESTTAQAWALGTFVQQVATAGNWANLWARVQGTVFNVKDYGAKGDGVTGDYAAIQAALSAIHTAGGGCLFLPPSGNYRVNAPLRVPSNTTVLAFDATVTLAANSSCNTLQSWGVQGNTRILDGVTNSTTTFTSSNATFSAANVGNAIRIYYQDGTYLDTTISAVTNTTTVTLAVAATQSETGLYAYFGSGRDSNIRILGGTWVRETGNYTGATNGWDSNNIRMRHVDGLEIGFIQQNIIQGKYGVNVGDVTSFSIHDVQTVFSVSDTVHINGPASWGNIQRISSLNSDDDIVSLTGADFHNQMQWMGDTLGNITDVTIRGVQVATPTNSGATTRGVLLLGGQSSSLYPCLLDRIRVEDVRSALNNYPIYIGPDPQDTYTQNGVYGYLLIDGGINHAPTPPGGFVAVRNTVTATSLEVRSVLDLGASTDVWIETGATVTTLRVSGVSVAHVSVQGSVTNLAVSDSPVNLSGTQTISGIKTFNASSGTGAITTLDLTVQPNPGRSSSASVFLDNTTGQIWEVFTDSGGTFGVYDDKAGHQVIAIDPGSTSLLHFYGGQVALTGLFMPEQLAAAPTYTKGAVYFDTTLNKLRIGGATGWETVTSS